MIIHTVMFKIKADSVGKAKRENAQKVKDRLASMKEKISEISRLDVGMNCIESDYAWDVVMRAEFEDEDALKRYQNHPEHIKLAEEIKSLRENFVSVDYFAAD